MAQSTVSGSRRGKYLTIGLIVLGVLLVVFFGLRAVHSFVRMRQSGLHPGTTNVELIRGWMTVPYISRAYGVPEEYLFEQLGIPPEGNRKKSLGQLNREYDLGGREAVLRAVQQAILKFQADHPPPPERGQ
ncbi:MAG: hypothetical protein D6784_09200 [Chloroflexi bacterium]|nr:MAG: hypothetical protein D6784_09200 [Chloroflexota bacterium]